jgi:MAF protein
MRFILASSSPRRREMIASLGIDFEIIRPEIDETLREGEHPLDYVRRLSTEKADVVASQLAEETDTMILAADTIVLAADTIGIVENAAPAGILLGKPVDADDVRAMLRLLRQQPHQVYTALRLLKLTRNKTSGDALREHYDDLVRTTVTMRSYTDAEIEEYIASGDPFDKAGSYAIQNTAFHPVVSIDGCYNNVVGLPLCAVRRGLAALGWPGISASADCDCPSYQPPSA